MRTFEEYLRGLHCSQTSFDELARSIYERELYREEKKPPTHHETPEQYTARTGLELMDSDAVWWCVGAESYYDEQYDYWELTKYGKIGWENAIIVVASPGLGKPENVWRPV